MFRGNTCAREMNVVSTAAVLPHAPPDVNGHLLNGVFIGLSKFKLYDYSIRQAICPPCEKLPGEGEANPKDGRGESGTGAVTIVPGDPLCTAGP